MGLVEIITFIALGLATGILSGLLGFGGGIFVVPCLYLIFQSLGFAEENLMHLVIGTSLATMISTSIVATWSHNKKQAVLWPKTKILMPGIIIGSIVGAIVADYIPSHFLTRFFGVFALVFCIYFLIPKIPKLTFTPSKPVYVTTGGIIGLLSSLLGIGGGTVAVPILIIYKMAVRNAIATSSSLTFITSVVGTVSYLFTGLNETFPHSFGFIYLPAFIAMSITTILSAPLGVKWAHYLDPKILKILYAIVLGIVGIVMIVFG